MQWKTWTPRGQPHQVELFGAAVSLLADKHREGLAGFAIANLLARPQAYALE